MRNEKGPMQKNNGSAHTVKTESLLRRIYAGHEERLGELIEDIPSAEVLIKGAHKTLEAAKKLYGEFDNIAFAVAYSSMFQTAKVLLVHLNKLRDIKEADRPLTIRLYNHYLDHRAEFLYKSCPMDIELRWMLSDKARGYRNETLHTGFDRVSKLDVEAAIGHAQNFMDKVESFIKQDADGKKRLLRVD